MKQFLSIVLSLLLTLASANLSLGMHFCGGEKVKAGIVFKGTELSCSSDPSEDDCEPKTTSNSGIHHKSCCQNLHYSISTESDFAPVSSFVFSPLVALYSSIPVHSFKHSWKSIQNLKEFEERGPPLIRSIATYLLLGNLRL